MRTYLLCLALLGFLPPVSAEEDTGRLWDVEFHKIRDDIYVAQIANPTDTVMAMGNVTVIINEHDVVLVDAGGAPVAARRIIAGIRKLTSKPVSTVIDTHWHGDHTLGNQEYAKVWPGVQIIARPETRAALLGDKIGYVKDIAKNVDSRRQQWGEVADELRKKGDPDDIKVADFLDNYFKHDIDVTQREYRMVEITPPDLTFTGDITLYRGKREIRLLYLGKANTEGDIVVYLPQEKLVASGDMVAAPPFAFKDALETDDTLEALDALDFDTLVPGHGPVLQGKDYLHQLQALLKDVERQVRPLMQQGLGVDDILKRMDLKAESDRFAGQDPVARYMFDLNFTQNYVQNLYDELKSGGS